MDVRPVKRRCLLTATLGIGLALGLQVGHAAEFGPLPEVKINTAKAELGKRLFFDKRLSGDVGIACSTCHQPENGFSTRDALSEGYPGNLHFRNSPTLINAVHKKSWMHDGRLGTNLNDVTREMLTETYLMNMDMRIMQERLKQDPVYLEMFKKAGYGEPSNGSVRKAIPEYLKTLTSRDAPFDTGKMSASANKGFEIFKGKGGCAQCHTGPLFSDGQPHNTGVPENFDVFLNPERHQAFLAYALFMGVENLYNLKRDPEAHVRAHKADGSDMVNKKMTHFNSQTGKVNIEKHPWSLFSDFYDWLLPKGDELRFTNGRTNEIWQSGFDDVERRPYVTQRWPENWVEIHPDDARKRGIESGDQVMLYCERVAAQKNTILGVHGNDFQFSELMKNGQIELTKGAVTAVAVVTPHVKKGLMFGNMIDMRQPTNALQPRVVDWISGNYNYKMGVAKVKKIGESAYKKDFRSMSFAPRNIV